MKVRSRSLVLAYHEGGSYFRLISELKDFFEVLPGIVAGPDSVFSFWNGLGATSKGPTYKLSTTWLTSSANSKTLPFTMLPRISPPCIWMMLA